MAINKKLFKKPPAEAVNGGANEAEQGLILHLDANDVDSYDGDGSVWYDISTHDLTVPLSDNADDLELHLNASDTTSYGGTGTTWTDLTSNNNATVVASTYDIDNGGYFNITSNTVTFSSNTSALDGTLFTFDAWVYQTSNSGTQYFFSDTGISFFTISGTQMRFIKYLSVTNNDTGYFNPTNNSSGWGTNKWNHVAVTFSSTTAKIYINGVLVHTNTEGSGTGTSLSTLQISPSAGRWKGYLGAFRIYDIELSASEVGQNYRHGRDYIYTDLIADTDLELHLDAASFPQKGESGYSNTPTTWTDSSSNSNNGTITGATFDSELGNWLDFDGVDDVVLLPTSVATSNFLSVELWFNSTSNDSPIGLFSARGSSSPTVRFLLTLNRNAAGDGTIGLDSASSSAFLVLGTYDGNYNDGKWHHVSATINYITKDYKVYIDGISRISGNNSSISTSHTIDKVSLGRNYNSQYLDGKIGQVRIYSSSLTQDEIRQNYNFTKNDYPNGYNGTLNGAAFNSEGSFEFQANDYLRFPTTSPFNDSNNIKAITGWVKADTTSSNIFLFNVSSTSNTSDYFYVSYQAGLNRIVVHSRDGSSSNQSLDIASITGNTNWNHIVVQLTDTDREIYLNGTKLSTTLTTAGTGSATSWIDYPSYASTVVGELGRLRAASPASTHYSDGKISKVKLYNKALTQTEITALYNEGE